MIRAVRMILAAVLAATVLAGTDPIERGVLRLHYVQKPIGYERYSIAQEGSIAGWKPARTMPLWEGRLSISAPIQTRHKPAARSSLTM